MLKEGKTFGWWYRTENGALAPLMAAILFRTGRQDGEALVDALKQMDMDEIDEIVEENLDEEDEEGSRGE